MDADAFAHAPSKLNDQPTMTQEDAEKAVRDLRYALSPCRKTALRFDQEDSMRLPILDLLTLSLYASFNLWLQTPGSTPTPTEEAINVPSSPVTLVTFKNGYEITNTSQKKIVTYRMGCALQGKVGVRVIETLQDGRTSLAPGQQITVTTIDNIEEAIAKCVKKKRAKLTIVSVLFEDGSSWQISDTRGARERPRVSHLKSAARPRSEPNERF